jgi:RNA polymerase sigma-70 factor (ECF subfamily)
LSGEREFDSLYRDAYRRLVGQVFVLTTDLGAAQDAVQEAFVRAWTGWARVSRLDSPEAWVRRVAMNVAVSGWRRVHRVSDALPADDDRRDVVLPDVVVELVDLLARLPATHRRVLALHHLVGLPVDAVAREVGVPVGTVKSWLSRGRMRLTALLDACEVTT